MVRFDDKLIPLAGAALGAIVTLAKSLGGWMERNSLTHKQQKQMEHASALSRFLQRLERMGRAGTSPEVVAEVRTKAQAELDSTLRSLSDVFDQGDVAQSGTARLSKPEQLLLLFRPFGWSAWIAHFLFYSSGLITLFSLIGSLSDDAGNWSYAAIRDNWRDSKMLEGLVLYAVLAVIANRWAVAERRARRFVYSPKERKYPNQKPIAMIAFVAYLFISLVGMLILPFTGYSGEQPRVFWARRVVALFAAVVAFFWMRQTSVTRMKTKWHSPRTTAEWAALVCLATALGWYAACSIGPTLVVPDIAQSRTADRILSILVFSVVPLLYCFEFARMHLSSEALDCGHRHSDGNS